MGKNSSLLFNSMTSISPVLGAMGVTEEIGRGAVRFNLGRCTTQEETDTVITNLKKIIIAN